MAGKKTVSKKKKTFKNVGKAQVHIFVTANNTICTVTDMHGNALAWSSPGCLGMKDAKKSSGYAAQEAVADAVRKAMEYGVTEVEVYIRGTGQGREQGLMGVQQRNLTVTMIKDVSPIPHNGCRPPKRRRL